MKFDRKPRVDNKTKEAQPQLTRKEQRELRKKRRMSENKYFEITERAKKIWEEMRRDDCPSNRKHELIENLMGMIKGKVRDIVRAHDTVRIIQCVIAYGTQAHRSSLFEELKEDLILLCKTKYAKHFVLKMLKYGSSKEKEFIISSFHGKVKDLLKHAHASQVLEYAYNDVANAKQRGLLVQEYYGPEFALFKDDHKLNLSKVLLSLSSEQRKKILDHLKEELVKLIDKGSIKHSITHHLLREFFTHGERDSIQELIALIRDLVVEILHTKDGARIACECIWLGNPKDRKMIVKSFRKFVAKIACEEQGHFALLAIFDAVDDTKLIDKVILSELFSPENVPLLLDNKNGLKVLEYLLSPRDPRFFHKDYVAKLTPGDNNPHSKKEQSIRWSELKSAASTHLINMVKNHAEKFFKEATASLLLANIVNNAEKGDRNGAMKAIVTHFNKTGPYKKGSSPENLHLIEKPFCSFTLKKLITHKTNNKEEMSFADIFCLNIESETLLSYILCNRGCFIVLSLFENASGPEAIQRLRAVSSVKKNLENSTFKGAKLLLEKLGN